MKFPIFTVLFCAFNVMASCSKTAVVPAGAVAGAGAGAGAVGSLEKAQKTLTNSFIKLTVADRKREKFTEAHIALLKTLQASSVELLNAPTTEACIAVLSQYASAMAITLPKAFVITYALKNKKTNKRAIERFTSEPAIKLEYELQANTFDKILQLSKEKKYTPDVLKTHCIRLFSTFVRDSKMCMAYKCLTETLGINADLPPESVATLTYLQSECPNAD